MCVSLVDTDVMEVYEICLQGNPEEHTILEFARLIKSLVGKVSDRSRWPSQSLSSQAWLPLNAHFTCPIVCFVLPILSYNGYASVSWWSFLFSIQCRNTFILVAMDVSYIIRLNVTVILYTQSNHIYIFMCSPIHRDGMHVSSSSTSGRVTTPAHEE